MRRLFCYIFPALVLAACAPELEDDTASGNQSLVVNAECAAAKSTLSADMEVIWSKEDRLAVLSLDGKTVAVSEPAGKDAAACGFKVNAWPSGVEPRYAVYNGTSEDPVASVEGRYIRTSVKTVQHISDETSFGRDANLSVGELQYSDVGGWQTEMKNVCALVGFSLERFDNVKAVSVYNRTGGKSISGLFDIFVEDGIPVVKEEIDGKSFVTATMADGENCFRTGTTYYICVRPDIDFTPDFVFLLSDGKRYKYRTEETVRLRRSTVKDFGVVDTDAFESVMDPTVSNENFTEGGSVELEVWEDKLSEGYHPRLVLDKGEFSELKGRVGGNDVVGKLHAHMVRVADIALTASDRYTSHLNADGTYISRKAAVRLISCAYAYRMTGLAKYIDKALQDIEDVCSLDTWGHEDSYLDVAELAAAVSIGYDWIYEGMPETLRSKVVNALKTLALETSRDSRYTWWYDRIGNWNQVCNSGLVCSAVAIYEYCPELAQEVIDDAIRTNMIAVTGIYGPDGAYPEGPTYWSFGAMFQTLMLTVLEDVFGTDYGISSALGFLETGLFKVFARGPNNMQFNYADNTLSATSAYPLFYFAYKRNDPSLLHAELEFLNEASYRNSGHKGYMILPIKYAMKMDLDNVAAGPSEKFYAAQGNVPVMMCRSGWGDDDAYLGIKGGKDGDLHGHMDGGTFVYYADGFPWALDVEREDYDNIRPAIHSLGGNLFDMSQTSLRWKLFRMHSRQHNTLTVNDKDHDVTAFVEMTATENTSSRMAATFDLTPLFGGDLAKAERTAALCDNSCLEVKDVLKAPADRPASVRWTLMTRATPTIVSDGISLVSGTLSRKLKTQGGNVTYRIWSSDINDYDNILMKDGKPVESPINSDSEPDKYMSICGYEIDIPAGQELVLTTRLERM